MFIKNISLPKNSNNQVKLFKKYINEVKNPILLCKAEVGNQNFLEIIDCNDQFLECFELKKNEVIGNEYNFLIKDESNHALDNYLDYLELIDGIKKLKPTSVIIDITYPRTANKKNVFKINFSPIVFDQKILSKDDQVYCYFLFEKLLNRDSDKSENLDNLLQNLQRVVHNEKVLQSISRIISSETDLTKIAKKISPTICKYLKIDKCIFFTTNKDDGAECLVENSVNQTKEVVNSTCRNDPSSPIRQYISFHNKVFSELNFIKKNSSTVVYEDINEEGDFEEIQDLCLDLGVRSQIVSTIVNSDGDIVGTLFFMQSTVRRWLLSEIEFIEIVSNEFSLAIDRITYINKLIFTNKELLEKTSQLSESLEKEKKMRELQSQFITLVSHEFKNPMQIIDGSRELISKKMKILNISDEILDKSLQRIKNSIFKMTYLIQGNLDLSKVEFRENGMVMEKSLFNIKSLIQDIVDRNLDFSNEKKVVINLDIKNMPEFYRGDEKLLEHSFVNILYNSIKYSKEGSKIEIVGKIQNGDLVLICEDNGIGIPEKDLVNIGSKFFRAENVSKCSGTGIGLYLTKNFIELHDGDLKIESQLDVGTKVTISLPIFN